MTIIVVEAAEIAHSVGVEGRAYAALVKLNKDDIVCGDPWITRVRTVNEVGKGPPEWYPTVVRGVRNLHAKR